jgi:hypothetical protein
MNDFSSVVYAPEQQDALNTALVALGDGDAAALADATKAYGALRAAPKVPAESWK